MTDAPKKRAPRKPTAKKPAPKRTRAKKAATPEPVDTIRAKHAELVERAKAADAKAAAEAKPKRKARKGSKADPGLYSARERGEEFEAGVDLDAEEKAEREKADEIEQETQFADGSIRIKRRDGTTRRPPKISPEAEHEILTRLADGETLIAVCRSDHLPSERTVRTAALWDEEFGPKYARAREIGYHRMGDEIITLGADTTIPPDRARIMVDSRKWLMSKALPKIYGDKLQIDGEMKHTHEHQTSAEIEKELSGLGLDPSMLIPSTHVGTEVEQ